MRDHSQHETSAIASTNRPHTAGDERNSMPRTTGSSATAVTTRVSSTLSSLLGGLRGVELLAGAAEAALAALVRRDRLAEGLGAEVGPERVGEVELGVRELPQQEVGDALLAAGADEEVWLGREGHRQALGEALLGDGCGGVVAAAAVGRLQDVPAPAVVGGDGEREPLVARGELLAAADELDDARVEARDVAHDLEADAVLVELADFLLERLEEELHEEGDFVGGAAPVLAREREQRQELHALLVAGLHHLAHRLDALAVAGHARQEPALRPPPVAVHDDRDVPRDGAHFRNGGGRAHVMAYTAIRSFAFSATSLSISVIALSVIFCTSSCARFSWSSLTSPCLSRSFRCWIASRRMLRMATLASSPSRCTSLPSSRRRSSVRAGMGTRMTSPEVAGFTPRSESRMAFSTTWTIFFS